MTPNLSLTPETNQFYFRTDIDWDMEVAFAQDLERKRDQLAKTLQDKEHEVHQLQIRLAYQQSMVKDLIVVLNDLLEETFDDFYASPAWGKALNKKDEIVVFQHTYGDPQAYRHS